MNVYFVSAGEVTTILVRRGQGNSSSPCSLTWRMGSQSSGDREAGLSVPETGFLVDLVAAPSRRAATYDFWQTYSHDLGRLTEQRWETKLIAKDVDRKRGVLKCDDPLWHAESLPGTLRP